MNGRVWFSVCSLWRHRKRTASLRVGSKRKPVFHVSKYNFGWIVHSNGLQQLWIGVDSCSSYRDIICVSSVAKTSENSDYRTPNLDILTNLLIWGIMDIDFCPGGKRFTFLKKGSNTNQGTVVLFLSSKSNALCWRTFAGANGFVNVPSDQEWYFHAVQTVMSSRDTLFPWRKRFNIKSSKYSTIVQKRSHRGDHNTLSVSSYQ